MIKKIKRELQKLSKSKFPHRGYHDAYKLFELPPDDDYISCNIRSGNTIGYCGDQPLIKPFKFRDGYKLEIFLKNDIAICIDKNKVLIFNEAGDLMNGGIPIFAGKTIDKESHFNLSTMYEDILTEDEIKQVREIMKNHFKNKSVIIAFKNIILAGLVPWKW